MIATDLALQKSISSYDQPQVVKIGISYDLPVGKGKGFGANLNPWLNNAVGGWKLQYIGNYNSGTPLAFAANSADSSTNLSTNRAQFTNPSGVGLGVPFNSAAFNAALVGVGNTSNVYLNTQYIKQPAAYTFGNAAPEIAQIRGFAGRPRTSPCRRTGRSGNGYASSCGERLSMRSIVIRSGGFRPIRTAPRLAMSRR